MNYGGYTLKTPTEIRKEEERLAMQEHAKLIAEQRDKVQTRRANYNKFITESKDFLMVEAMTKLLENCFPSTLSEENYNLARNCCRSFVKEEGVNNILKRCKSTQFLNEFIIIFEDTHKEIIHGATDCKEDEFEINNSVMQKYYDRLRTLNYGPMCNAIIDRVAEAERDFVTANIKDKEKIEDAAEKTAEKIKAINIRYEETEEKIKEEYTLMYKNEVDNIANRRRNILESIIKRLGEAVIVSEHSDLFLNESGKLNTTKVIESGEVMYTFLEMVNTCNIKVVDREYLESILKSIK